MTTCKIETCDREAHTRGWCATHYRRVMRRGDAGESVAFSGTAKTIEQRLGEKSTYVPFCGCRLWFGASVPQGYGVTHFNHRQQYAHRVAWQVERGPIPEGLLVLHKCDTPACINVDHLFLGTDADNRADMMNKGRSNPARGDNAGKSKLTAEIVKEIRAIYKPYDREFGGGALAKKYGVSPSTVTEVVNNRYWSHI